MARDDVKLDVHAFASTLRAWLENHNQTQNDLARACDISNAALSNWLAEKSAPDSLTMLVKLEQGTGIPLSRWVGLLTKRSYDPNHATRDEVAAIENRLKEIKRRIG